MVSLIILFSKILLKLEVFFFCVMEFVIAVIAGCSMYFMIIEAMLWEFCEFISYSEWRVYDLQPMLNWFLQLYYFRELVWLDSIFLIYRMDMERSKLAIRAYSPKKKKGHACDFSEKGQKNKIFENFDKMIQNLKMVWKRAGDCARLSDAINCEKKPRR